MPKRGVGGFLACFPQYHKERIMFSIEMGRGGEYLSLTTSIQKGKPNEKKDV
jgi:hypothetical protein